MGNGLTNLRDQKFNLLELLDIQQLFKTDKYADYNIDDVNMLLSEAEKMAVNELLPTYSQGDREGCTFTDGQVKVPACFHAPYQKLYEAGWPAATQDPEVGGQGMPLLLYTGCMEMLCAANYALMMYPGLTSGSAKLVEAFGSEEQKQKYMYKMFSGELSGTMCLTEPGAGTDVGALKTRARRRPDGRYMITGTKIFISSGDHDLTDNRVHAVLARIEGDPAGTRGISIFLVPKYLINDDGSKGDFNDVNTGGIEHKMGIKGSATCVLNFGEQDSCIGELLGTERQGMKIMFHMMNEARLMTGLQGLGHASAAYENALAYARERVQSRSLRDINNPDAASVAIIKHPDVRRTLLLMKAYVEGIRSMNYFIAFCIDMSKFAENEDERGRWSGMVDLLTPISKAVSSDRGMEICSYAIDLHGGYGYCSEYPIEQFLRDAKIACIYEGTNGVQGLDFVGRKLSQNRGVNVKNLFESIAMTVAEAGQCSGQKVLAEALQLALETVNDVTMQFKEWSSSSILPILNSRPFLNVFGDLIIGWQLVKGAVIAAENLDNIYRKAGAVTVAERRRLVDMNSDAAFYEGKVASARYFMTTIIPDIKGRCDGILAGDMTPMEMADVSFG